MGPEDLSLCQAEQSRCTDHLVHCRCYFLMSQNVDQCLGPFCSTTHSDCVFFVIQVNLLGGDVHRDGYGIQAPQIPLTGMGA